MKPYAVADFLRHIRSAAQEALDFAAGISERDFEEDVKTQRAVVMNLIIVGEAAARLIEKHPEFVKDHPEIDWRAMRGMRNRMTHGYFEIDPATVWMTLSKSIPSLLADIDRLL